MSAACSNIIRIRYCSSIWNWIRFSNYGISNTLKFGPLQTRHYRPKSDFFWQKYYLNRVKIRYSLVIFLHIKMNQMLDVRGKCTTMKVFGWCEEKCAENGGERMMWGKNVLKMEVTGWCKGKMCWKWRWKDDVREKCAENEGERMM